ncbi:diguanylate cyclase [Anaerobacillus sp. MEB173]|uniref:diguanylate cyclase n=1 Tax=Anaerobacillus sp. MEB173 TaxID=3383345 RepID=UPI003F93DDBF
MGYKGRVVTTSLIICIHLIYIFYYYTVNNQLEIIELIGFPIVVLVGWFFGKKYDQSVYYKLQANKAKDQVTNILDSITSAYFAFDHEWRFVKLNKTAEKILNGHQRNLVGLNLWDEFPDLIDTTIHINYIKAKDTQQENAFEFYYESLHKWYFIHVYPNRDGLAVFLIDITEQKQTEKALKESQERYRSLVTFLPDPMVVHQDNIIVFANEKAGEIVNIHSSEAIGKSIYDFILPEYHESMKKRLWKLYHMMEEDGDHEFKIITKDQKILDIEAREKPIYYNGKPAMQVLYRDVSERKSLEEKLLKIEERYRFITENSTDLIAILTTNGNYDYVSPACLTLLGYRSEEIIGQSVLDFLPSEDVAHGQKLIEEAHELLGYLRLTHRFQQKNRGYIWLETIAKRLENRQGELEFILVISRDITERMDKEHRLVAKSKELQHLSFVDGLTKIPNRRAFDKAFRKEWTRCKRRQTPLSLIMIDIDYFKEYNDHYGHLAGDDCLRKIASSLKDGLYRADDFIARYGGEEFVVLLPETNAEGAILVVEKLLEYIRELTIPHCKSDVSNVITASAGLATIMPIDEMDMEDLILYADQALYRAKRSGKNQVQQYTANLLSSITE